jgi:hypothetical protein
MHRGGASAWRSNLVDTHGLLERDANIRAGDAAFRMSLGDLGDLGATEQRNHMFCHMKPLANSGKSWIIRGLSGEMNMVILSRIVKPKMFEHV